MQKSKDLLDNLWILGRWNVSCTLECVNHSKFGEHVKLQNQRVPGTGG